MVVDTKPQEKKLPVHKSIYLLPNLITSLSMFMGFLSMVWAVQSRFEEAGLAIVLSALLDGPHPASGFASASPHFSKEAPRKENCRPDPSASGASHQNRWKFPSPDRRPD